MHRIHLNLLYSASLPVVRTGLKLLKRIKFMSNPCESTLKWWFKQIQTIHNTFNACETTLLCWSTIALKRYQNFRNTSNSCWTIPYCWFTSHLNKFKPFTTHRIHVKIPYSGGMLVASSSQLFSNQRIPALPIWSAPPRVSSGCVGPPLPTPPVLCHGPILQSPPSGYGLLPIL